MLQSLAQDHKLLHSDITEEEVTTKDKKEDDTAPQKDKNGDSSIFVGEKKAKEENTPEPKLAPIDKPLDQRYHGSVSTDKGSEKKVLEKKPTQSFYETSEYYIGDIRSDEFKAMASKSKRSRRRSARSRSRHRSRSRSSSRSRRCRTGDDPRSSTDSSSESRNNRESPDRRDSERGRRSHNTKSNLNNKPGSELVRAWPRTGNVTNPMIPFTAATVSTHADADSNGKNKDNSNTCKEANGGYSSLDLSPKAAKPSTESNNTNLDNYYRKYSSYNRVIWGDPFISVPPKEHMTMSHNQLSHIFPLGDSTPQTPQLQPQQAASPAPVFLSPYSHRSKLRGQSEFDVHQTHTTPKKSWPTKQLTLTQKPLDINPKTNDENMIEKRFHTGLTNTPSLTQTQIKCMYPVNACQGADHFQ